MRTVLRQLVFFGFVGALATGTHYVTALAVHEMTGANLYLSNLAGYACGIAVSYLGHAKLTFRVAPSRRTFWRYIVASAVAFFSSEAVLAMLEAQPGLSHRVALALAVVVIPVITFLLNKFWVYRQATDADTAR